MAIRALSWQSLSLSPHVAAKTSSPNPARAQLTARHRGDTVQFQDNIKQAKALLRECGKNVKQMLAGAAGTSIIVQGVEMMNDDPHNMDVLYASAFFGREKGGLLQEIADHLQTAFANAGFLEPEHDHVKLHATLINSKKRWALLLRAPCSAAAVPPLCVACWRASRGSDADRGARLLLPCHNRQRARFVQGKARVDPGSARRLTASCCSTSFARSTLARRR